MISLILLFKIVPNPGNNLKQLRSISFWKMFKIVWEVPALRTISWGGFVCGLGLSSTFFMIPIILFQYGIDRAEMWKIYLPMLLIGAIVMILSSFIVDLKNCFKEVMLFGIILMLLSLVFMGFGKQHGLVSMFIVALYLFFMGFNIFEPILPSLVSKISTNETKGTAVGVYNFAQFFGHFVGATIAGVLFLNHYFVFLFIVGAVEILFFYLTIFFPNPKKGSN